MKKSIPTISPLAELLLVFLLPFLIVWLGVPLVKENPIGIQIIIWIANVLMLFCIWLSLKSRGQSFQSLGLKEKLSFKNIIQIILLSFLVFVAAALFFNLGSIVSGMVFKLNEGPKLSGYNYFNNNWPLFLLSLVGVYIVSSFGEEIVYRGYLISRLQELNVSKKLANSVAVLISAIIFGLVHYRWGTAGIIQTGFMGLALGIAYLILKKRLWILILAHAYLDTIILYQAFVQ